MKLVPLIASMLIGTAGLAQTPTAQNNAPRPQPKATTGVSADTVAIQVMLDRAGFSPGEIDGRAGNNFMRAVAAFQRAHALTESGAPDDQTTQKLTEAMGGQPAFIDYVVREADIAGPFTPKIPTDLVAQSKLTRLWYETPLEALSERFHTNPQLLQRLNSGVSSWKAGQTITVPNVEPFDLPAPAQGKPFEVPQPDSAQEGRGRAGRAESRGATGQADGAAARGRRGAAPAPPAFTIAVTKATSALTVEDASGRVVFHAPVTTGSEHDPLPIGNWKVTTVQVMPKFHYNPDLFWDANPKHSKATLPAGPNNPVGVAWIDISKEHYGIHGTPQPSRIGYAQSHGCVRLTNWDVQRLLAWAQPGTAVVFRE